MCVLKCVPQYLAVTSPSMSLRRGPTESDSATALQTLDNLLMYEDSAADGGAGVLHRTERGALEMADDVGQLVCG